MNQYKIVRTLRSARSTMAGYAVIAVFFFSVQSTLAVFPFDEQGSAIGNASDARKRVIVLFEEHAMQHDIQNILSLGGQLRHIYDVVPGAAMELDNRMIDLLEKMPSVRGVFEDMQVHVMLSDSIPQIRADEVQSIPEDGNGVKICVVDTGVEDSHSDLSALLLETDFVNNDNNASDDHGHGTHVAGIIASNDSTNRGVAPGASLMAAKVLDQNGSGFTSDVIAGVNWCKDNGAHVINLSLGGGSSTTTCDGDPLAQAINAAVDAGVTVMVASGNNGYVGRISIPACASKGMAIGSVDTSDIVASYSNGSSELDVVAPGSSIISTYPPNRFASLSGTSMATPHAAGVAALLLGKNPALTPAEIRSILRGTAVDLGANGFDIAYGHGRIDAKDAYDAVGGGGGGEPPPPPPSTPTYEQVFFDDFQTGAFNLWTETNEFDWEVSGPAERQVPGKPGNNEVAHADRCSSGNGCYLMLRDSINMTGYDGIKLGFWRYVDRSLDNGEYLRIEAYDGSSWNVIDSWTHRDGDDDTWHEESYELGSNYLVSNFSLRFISRESSSIEETEIDDVLVEGMIPGDSAPTAVAGSDQTLSDGDNDSMEEVTIDGSSSSDDQAIVSFEWTEDGVVLGTTEVLTHDFDIGTHEITLVVTDDGGQADSDDATVTVVANQSPVADAGADQTVSDADSNGEESVTLDGSSSTDSDGTIVSYEWKADTTILGTDAIINTTLPLGVHVITLTVTDSGGTEQSDFVDITVVPNQPPQADAGGNQTVSDADGSGTESITLDGSGSSDIDGTVVSHVWKEGAVVLGTGALITRDFSVGLHTVTLTVVDNSGNSATDSIDITVFANQSPIAEAGTSQTVTDNDDTGEETVTLDGSSSSDPDGAIASYKWKDGALVLGTNAVITSSFSVGTHVLSLTVTDNAGATATDSVSVTVDPFVPPPAGPVTIFDDDFQSGFAKWNETGEGDWVVQSPQNGQVPGYGGGNSVAHSNQCRSSCTIAVSSSLDLSEFAQAELRLWRSTNLNEFFGEYLRVEISNGGAWTTLANWTSGNGSWNQETLSIPSSHLVLGFALRFVGRQNFFGSVELDDVIIEAEY